MATPPQFAGFFNEVVNREVNNNVQIGCVEGTGNDKVYAIPLTDANRLTQEQQEANATYIYNYLSDKGWTTEAIAGLLGNIQQESQMNPGVWQRQDNTNLGYGLVQWDDATKFLDAKNLSVDGANKLAQNDPQKLILRRFPLCSIGVKQFNEE